MKIWVERYFNTTISLAFIHLVEPMRRDHNCWEEIEHCVGFSLDCDRIERILGYRILPQPYLMEFDLSGTPKCVAVWEPCEETT